MTSLPLASVVLVVLVVTAAGAVNGIAGFGFALVGTLVLAGVLDPATAVAFMIVPILAVNATLARDLSGPQLRTCGRRFRPLLLAALLGTAVGMALLDVLPADGVRIGLGLLAIGFVATAQRRIRIPGLDRAKAGCFVERPAAMVAVGAVSGIIFGATNVGVQLVAYLRSCQLSHALFVGVVAMVFLGLNTVRIGLAAAFGLYGDLAVFALSLGAIVPAVLGVEIGRRLRTRVSDRRRRQFVLGLLTLIGVRLLLAGAGIA